MHGYNMVEVQVYYSYMVMYLALQAIINYCPDPNYACCQALVNNHNYTKKQLHQ